jgi:hypothetical protein
MRADRTVLMGGDNSGRKLALMVPCCSRGEKIARSFEDCKLDVRIGSPNPGLTMHYTSRPKRRALFFFARM